MADPARDALGAAAAVPEPPPAAASPPEAAAAEAAGEGEVREAGGGSELKAEVADGEVRRERERERGRGGRRGRRTSAALPPR